MHNNVHIDNILLHDSDRSPVLIDFGWALTREREVIDQEWENSVTGCQDVRFARRVLLSKRAWDVEEEGDAPPDALLFSAGKDQYVENQLEDYRRRTFERFRGQDGKVQENKCCSGASGWVFTAEMTRRLMLAAYEVGFLQSNAYITLTGPKEYDAKFGSVLCMSVVASHGARIRSHFPNG